MTNDIHPTAVIGDNVVLGKNNKILAYTVLQGPLTIGDNNIIGPHVVIGSPGQDTRSPRYDSSRSVISIGNNNIIREFTAIQKPCYKKITLIGDDVFLMQSVHIPHDAILENKVVITPMCVLAGVTTVLEGANLGMGCSIHQYTIIGQYSLVATGAAVVKNVKPFSRYVPGKSLSVNTYAINKFGYEQYNDEISKYVINNILPKSDSVVSIVEKYKKLHVDSKRSEY